MYTLTAIQLLAVTKVSTMKNNKSIAIFQDVIDDLNKLSGEGLELSVCSEKKVFNGYLAFFLGDTPALNWLGGFKETCSKAFRFCRTCDIQHGEIHFNDSKLKMRQLKTHLIRLGRMKRAKTESETKRLSKQYGINYESFLLKINFFDISKCLLQDPMHILYEGVCHDELTCFFDFFLRIEKMISLEQLNEKIKKFNYFKSDKTDIPNEISYNNINQEVFTQTSGQIKTLFHNLPLMIGNLFSTKSKENWSNFLRLLNIINRTFTFVYNDQTISDLRNEIENYLKNFTKLYPNHPIKPKHHFMSHFPNQMRLFGPLRLHATMRLESKNGLVKAHKFKNFVNISKSVSFRQEYWIESKRVDKEWKDKDNFLSKGIEIRNLIESSDCDFCEHYNFKVENNLYTAEQIKINGFTYDIGTFLILNDNLNEKSNSIGCIENIFLAREEPVFKFKFFDIVSFDKAQNVYKIKESRKGFCFKFYKNMIHKQSTLFSIKVSETEFLLQIRYFFNLLK